MTALKYPGAYYLGKSRCWFSVWAPTANRVDVHIISPEEQFARLQKDDLGYHCAIINGVEPTSLYSYRLDDNQEYPDPASSFQPQGVHGPSQVIAHEFPWGDSQWRGLHINKYVIYELHVGTFTKEGNFEAIIPRIRQLKELGVTALDLMPVAQFPGNRNWGYDAVYPFAVQESYGGPWGLKKLVNACHSEGICVILDVIYNHLGPEGNYFERFGPYFTDRYHNLWGKALNFDGPYCDEVRRFFIANVRYWFTEFHVDALRLDALHAILDFSPQPFLQEVAASVVELRESLRREIYLIGESDANDRRILISPARGGYGMHAQWNDDFHHALHVLLTGETSGYYQDFGKVQQLAKAFEDGFIYSGQYSSFRKRRHGSNSEDIPPEKFVVFSQNHDQIGNRPTGARLSSLVNSDKLRQAAGIVIFSPFIPLIFMGEEYGETAPFQYFVSFGDPILAKAVRQGRRKEFPAFQWQGEIPDPQEEATFLRSKLNPELKDSGPHRALENYYRKLFRLRKEIKALRMLSKKNMEVRAFEKPKVLYVRRWKDSSEAVIISNFADKEVKIKLPVPEGQWSKSLDSVDEEWLGKGSQLPCEFYSTGEKLMDLAANSLVLFTQR